MSYDLLIKNGMVVDGTGAAPRRADVAIAAGKIAEIGKVAGSAKKGIDAAERRGSGINLGFMAALTPFRHYVMGEDSMERAANASETAQIKALIKEAVSAGAFGFTTTAVPQHIGYKGRPIACRNASRDEF